MTKKKVIVSFDYEHDRQYYYLLKAWDANDDFDFFFSDLTPKEIQSESVNIIKKVLSEKIHEADYMIALIGAHSDEQHPDHNEIGYKNWQAYEIAKNFEWGNKLVVVKLDSSYYAPDEAYDTGAEWVYSFNEEDVIDALNRL